MTEPRDPPLLCVTGMRRTGTTWLTRILADALGVASSTRDFTWDTLEVAKWDAAVYRLDRPGRLIRRGHWTITSYPYWESPVICIIRDPRAMMASKIVFDNKEDRPLAHTHWRIGVDQQHSEWRDFYCGWMDRGVPILRYRDLHERPLETIKTALAACDIPVPTDERIVRSIEWNNFERMVREGRKNALMRRGKLGGWRDELPARAQKHIEKVCGDIMEQFGWTIGEQE